MNAVTIFRKQELATSTFEGKCECIRLLLSTAARDDARTRYQVGAHIRDVMENEAQYGDRAVGRLADALGRDEATLYRYALVAERWETSAFEALLGRQTARGEPLSWTHFVELAAEEEDALREKYLERVFKEGLSVRAAAALVRAGGEVMESARSPVGRLGKIASALEEAKERAEAALNQLDTLDARRIGDGYLRDLVMLEALQCDLQRLAKMGRERIDQVKARIAERAHVAEVVAVKKVAGGARMPSLLSGAAPRLRVAR